jgi:hypothetical protein
MAYRPYILIKGVAINFDRVTYFERSGECGILLYFDNFKEHHFEFEDENKRESVFNSLFYCLSKRDIQDSLERIEDALKKIAQAIG